MNMPPTPVSLLGGPLLAMANRTVVSLVAGDTVFDAARLMATHTSPLAEGPLLCAHRESGTSQTLSCSIYRCRSGQLFFSDGNPCQGDWVTYCLADHAADAPQTAKRH